MKIENPYEPGRPRGHQERDVDYEHRMANALGWNEGCHSRDEVVDGLVEACRAVDSDIASYWDVHVLRISDRSWQLVKEAIAKAKP